MSIKNEVRQNLDKIAGSSAVQLVAGFGGVAAEKLRAAQARLANVDFQARVAEVPERLAKAQRRAQARVAEVPSKIAALRADPRAAQEAAKQVPERAQGAARQLPERAQDLALQLTGKAVQTYAELTERGRILIARQRAANGARHADLAAVEPIAPAAVEVATAVTPPVVTPVETAPPSNEPTRKAPAKNVAGTTTSASKAGDGPTAARKTTAKKAVTKKTAANGPPATPARDK